MRSKTVSGKTNAAIFLFYFKKSVDNIIIWVYNKDKLRENKKVTQEETQNEKNNCKGKCKQF